jgi:hypothetical protein
MATKSEFAGQTRSIDQQAAKSQLEAELAATQDQINAAKAQHAQEETRSEAAIRRAAAQAQESAGAASAFSPDKRLKGKALKKAQSHDMDLDLQAQSDSAKVARLEKLVQDKDAVFEMLLQALEKQAETQKNAVKNLNM